MKNFSIRRHVFRILRMGRVAGLLVLLLLLGLRVWDPVPIQIMRLATFDVWQKLYPRQTTSNLVAVVDIDEKSLREKGQWPWPRSHIADMVTKLSNAGALAIGINVLFAEEDRMSPQNLVQTLELNEKFQDLFLAELPATDAALAESLKQGPTVLGQAYGTGVTEAALTKWPKTALATIGPDPAAFVPDYGGLIRNIFDFENAAQGRGVFAMSPEVDGVVRRVPAILRVGNDIVPSLYVEMLRVATGQTAYAVRTDEAGIVGVVVRPVMIPTDRSGRVWVRYGDADKTLSVSAVDLLNGTVEPDQLKGKLVLIGTSAAGTGELSKTALGGTLPGVNIQAELLETILTQSFLSRPNFVLGAELILLAVSGLILIVFVTWVGARWSLAILVLLVGGIIAGGWYGFTNHFYLVDTMYPAMSTLAVFLALAYAGYQGEERQKARVRRAFGQYLSPVMVERLASDAAKLELGGEVRTMTVMFSDIRGFTTLAERFKDDPRALTKLINRFLTPMSDDVMARRGTIDKYIGDCLMAFWNAPLDDPEHQRNACLCALDMLKSLDNLNAELRKEVMIDRGMELQAAKENYAMAQRYARGDGVERDQVRAFELLLQEAESGFADAQYQVAKAYRNGVGTERDASKAARWFLAAAEQGMARAQRNIASRYATGAGIEQNSVEAVKWAVLGAEHNLITAEQLLRKLRDELPPEDIAAGEKRAATWSPEINDKRAIRLDVGIGLNTGSCVVGNMGSERRFDYSVLGDTVNLASRLEGQTKTYGVGVVISEETTKGVPELAVLELDRIAVKGKSEAVTIYGLLGDENKANDENFQELQEHHQELLSQYREQNWEAAKVAAKACKDIAPELETLYILYQSRIAQYESEPPGEDWDGVFIAKSK